MTFLSFVPWPCVFQGYPSSLQLRTVHFGCLFDRTTVRKVYKGLPFRVPIFVREDAYPRWPAATINKDLPQIIFRGGIGQLFHQNSFASFGDVAKTRRIVTVTFGFSFACMLAAMRRHFIGQCLLRFRFSVTFAVSFAIRLARHGIL